MKLQFERLILVALFAPTLVMAAPDSLEAKANLGRSILELGGTAGSLAWTSVSSENARLNYPDNEFYQLATRIQTDLDNAKASSSFGRATGKAGAASFSYMAYADPEPISKISFAVAAYATQAATSYLADATYNIVQEQSLDVLRKALENKKNNLTPQKILAMKKDDFINSIDGFMLGNKTMRDVFIENPKALEMLKSNVSDFLVSNSAATLFSVKKISADVESSCKALEKVSADLEEFRGQSVRHLKKIEEKTDDLLQVTKESSAQLAKLQFEIRGNSKAIQTLSDISYLGWSTEQKLAAVKAGQFFPALKDKSLDAMIQSLEADMHREKVISELQLISRDISSISTIAANIGLPKNVLAALDVTNTATNALIKFTAGDVLGSVASLSNLFGRAKIDPAAERHKQLMNYLSEQFGEVNQRLEKIQRLQEKTLIAVADLSNFMLEFRSETHLQLTSIESQVLLNNAMVGAIINAEWRPCRALRDASNNRPWFSSRQQILDALGPGDNAKAFRDNWKMCNSVAFDFLKGDITTGHWAGGVADMRTAFSQDSSRIETQRALIQYANLRVAEYEVARDVLFAAAPNIVNFPTTYLIRLGQPSSTVSQRNAFVAQLELEQSKLGRFKCDSTILLNNGQHKLVCWGAGSEGPRADRIKAMFGDSLIGPNGWSLMDSMISVSRTAAFVRLDNEDKYKFLTPQDLDTTSSPSVSLKTTLSEQRGLDMLNAMSPMAELNILQQSVAYGDLVPQLVLNILFDAKSRTLSSQINIDAELDVQIKQAAALKALQINPILGRNVVMLAVRKMLVDEQGNFPVSYYKLATLNYSGQQACTEDPVAKRKLVELFPGWNLEYRKDQNEELTLTCKDEDAKISRGSGLVLNFGGFYVKMPSAEIAGEGIFEYPQSLATALRYREKINMELIDRNIYKYFKNDQMKVEFLNVASKLN